MFPSKKRQRTVPRYTWHFHFASLAQPSFSPASGKKTWRGRLRPS
jgi:hypothetical protein